MHEYDEMALGDAPAEEDGEALGYDRGDRMAHREQCKRYIDLLKKTFAPILEGTGISLRRKVENGGEYAEVVATYNANNLNEQMVALFMENNQPARWSDSKVYSKAEFEEWLSS